MPEINFANVPKHLATRTHEAMQPVLMNSDASGPSTHYYMIRGGSQQRNVTVWEPGTVGGEYIKTFGHYHVGELDETYWIVSGEGLVVQQKLADDGQGGMVPNMVTEFKVTMVKPGDNVFIPAGYGHLAINTGSTYFVTVDDSPVDFGDADPSGKPGHADYSLVEQMRGFAYYVVEREGKPALIRNSRYKSVSGEDFAGLPVVEA
jgi:glucose-6-phosphate isomerase, archaeal